MKMTGTWVKRGSTIELLDGDSPTRSTREFAGEEESIIPPLCHFPQRQPEPYVHQLDPWAHLITFRPSLKIQTEIKNRAPKGKVHRIEDAIGRVNFDYHPVSVSLLPEVDRVVNGIKKKIRLTPEEFLTYIRLNINDFVGPTRFYPYDQHEERIWRSANPLGAVVSLKFRGTSWGFEHPVDDGSVVVGFFRSSSWIVSTIWTARDGKHFLSGIRQWGYSGIPGDYIYYTRAVDRMTPYFPPVDKVYNEQRQFWGGFQQKVCAFVVNHKGQAEVLPQSDVRHDWESVEPIYHRNKTKVPWLEDAAAPNPAKPGNTHTVVSGDSLSLIAGKFWDDALLWPILYDSNKAVVGSNPNLIKPGQVLTIPDIRPYSPSQLSNVRARGRNWR